MYHIWMICFFLSFIFRLIFCQKWSVCQSKLIKHWMSDKLKDHEVSQAETRFRHAPMRLSFFVASSSLPLFLWCTRKKKLYILSIRTGFTAIKYIFTAIITILKSHIPINFLMQTFLTPVLHLSKYILTLVSTYHQVVNTKWKCTAYIHRDRSWSHVLRIEKTLMRKLDKIELVPN